MIQNLAAFIAGGTYYGPHLPTVVRSYGKGDYLAVIAIEGADGPTRYIVARTFNDANPTFVVGLIATVDEGFAPYLFGIARFADATEAWANAERRAQEGNMYEAGRAEGLAQAAVILDNVRDASGQTGKTPLVAPDAPDHPTRVQIEDDIPHLAYYVQEQLLSFTYNGKSGPWIDVSYGGYGEPVIERIPFREHSSRNFFVYGAFVTYFKSACNTYAAGRLTLRVERITETVRQLNGSQLSAIEDLIAQQEEAGA